MKPSVVLTFLLFAHLSALATDYYIANNGSDSNSGTASNAPWRTLEKLSAELGGPSGTWGTITSGDRVFFQRGDVFRGFIAFAAYNNNGITFDAYGAGGKPVIKGSVPVTEWTQHSGNIWKATVPQRVYFLYQGGTAQTLARAPNSGHWTATSASSSSITGNDIGASGLDLVGANVCIREYDWQLNRQVVSGQSGNTVDWSSAIGGTPSDDSNVYFDNKLELLDAVGEWYWDAATTTLYYMTDGTDPTSLTVEASVYLVGIAGNDNRSNNAFRNLYFAHYAQEGIRLMGASNNNTIDNCTFSDNFQALFLSGSGSNVQNNNISASYLQGVVLANMGNSTFSNNTVSDAGMVYGKHRPDFTGEFYSGGIWLINGNAGSVISYNTVSSTGGMGIRFNGSGVIIERNSVNNAMANMDDGGGIYTWGGNNSSYSNTIRYNVVSNMTGSHNGTPPGNIVNGIYIDNYAYNITLEKNTIQNIPNGSGIVINAGAHGCTVTGNVTHGCSRGLGMYDWLPGQSVYGNTLSGNTFYANTPDAVPVEIASDDNNYNVFAASDNNFLINPYDTHVVRYLWSSNQTFTLPQWRTATGLDMASVGTYYVWTFPTDYSFVATNDSPAPAVRNFSNVRDLNNMNVTQVTLPPFSSQVFIDASNLSPLPVELMYFKGSKQPGHQALLTWQTAGEYNAASFEVEKSEDATTFKQLADVPAYNSPASYKFVDEDFSKDAYYRLKIKDIDGTFEYSSIISLQQGDHHALAMYPNPVVNGILYVQNDGTEDWVQLYNASGNRIKILPLGQGLNVLNVQDLPSQTYLVRTKHSAVSVFVQNH